MNPRLLVYHLLEQEEDELPIPVDPEANLKSEILHSGLGNLYWTWRRLLDKSKRKNDNGQHQLKLANNTYMIEREDGLAIRLHQTDVITAFKDGRVVVSSGGWPTITTRDRINSHLPKEFGWGLFSQSGVGGLESVAHPAWEGGYSQHRGQFYPVSGRRGLSPMFWYNHRTGEGTHTDNWYIPFTDGDYLTVTGELHPQAEKIPRKKRRK